MSLDTRVKLGAAVVTIVALGLAVNSLVNSLVNTGPWPRLNENRDGRRPGQPTVDQRLDVEATVSSDPVKPLATVVTAGEAGPAVTSFINEAQGWERTSTGWKKTFGPFRRGDPFTLQVSAPSGHVQVLCKLRTVGKAQIKSPPQQVAGKDGRASCAIVAGD